MIRIREAKEADFPEIFPLIQTLWNYNTYEITPTFAVYQRILAGEESFAFLAGKEDRCIGFCHGDFFPTLWMCGMTCYLSGIITHEDYRGQGVGTALLDQVKHLAKARGCKAIIIDSGIPRKTAHQFYETYGFEKSCYGFELPI